MPIELLMHYSSTLVAFQNIQPGQWEGRKGEKNQDPASEMVLVRVSQVFSEVFKSSRPARLQRSHQIHNFFDSCMDPCVRVHICSI